MRSLVTSSGQRHHLLQKVLDKPGLWGLLCYISAIYYAQYILNRKNAEPTRISEHALMPGLVTERFDMDGRAIEYLNGLKDNRYNQDYISNTLKTAGLSCYEQHWWTTVKVLNASGQNVYCVLRAPRATGVESMLIAVDLTYREASAMVMAYATFAREQVYWARDVFFVFVDGGAAGMDAWLSNYHLVQSNGITGDPLQDLGGILIGGVVLKSQAKRSDHGRYINIELNYLNGQLPNLDLFNSVVRIAGTGKFALHSLVYNVKDYDKRGRDWHMLVPLRFIYTQAFVSVEGMHSVLGKYGVQGVSISLPSISSYPMRQSTRLLEAIARSMNNILERFHQSYFIYILASEESFVSIAYFMPVIGGIIAPLLMFAYRDWALMASFYIPTSYLLLHLIGFMIWIISSVHFSHYTHNVEQDIFLFGIVTLIPWGLLIPVYPSSFRCLRFLLLLECSLLTGVVSLLNFSLAFCFAIIAVPIIIKLTQENDNRLRSIIRIICGFCCHPFNLYVIFLIYVLPYLGYGRKSMQINLNTFTSVFLRLVQEHLTFGSNMLPFLLVFVLPIWNAILSLAAVISNGVNMNYDKMKTD